MKVKREPKRPFSLFVNDSQIVRMATLIFEDNSRATVKVFITKAARGLTKEEIVEAVANDFKVLERKVIKILLH